MHIQKRGYLLHRSALVKQLSCVLLLLRGEFWLASKFYSSALCGFYPSTGALVDQTALEFGKNPDHMPHRTACGCLGVDVLSQGAKFDTLGA